MAVTPSWSWRLPQSLVQTCPSSKTAPGRLSPRRWQQRPLLKGSGCSANSMLTWWLALRGGQWTPGWHHGGNSARRTTSTRPFGSCVWHAAWRKPPPQACQDLSQRGFPVRLPGRRTPCVDRPSTSGRRGPHHPAAPQTSVWERSPFFVPGPRSRSPSRQRADAPPARRHHWRGRHLSEDVSAMSPPSTTKAGQVPSAREVHSAWRLRRRLAGGAHP